MSRAFQTARSQMQFVLLRVREIMMLVSRRVHVKKGVSMDAHALLINVQLSKISRFWCWAHTLKRVCQLLSIRIQTIFTLNLNKEQKLTVPVPLHGKISTSFSGEIRIRGKYRRLMAVSSSALVPWNSVIPVVHVQMSWIKQYTYALIGIVPKNVSNLIILLETLSPLKIVSIGMVTPELHRVKVSVTQKVCPLTKLSTCPRRWRFIFWKRESRVIVSRRRQLVKCFRLSFCEALYYLCTNIIL